MAIKSIVAFEKQVRDSIDRVKVLGYPLLVERSPSGSWFGWSVHDDDPRIKRWLSEAECIAIVFPDGSAQLLSRDEDECLLFATLWELER